MRLTVLSVVLMLLVSTSVLGQDVALSGSPGWVDILPSASFADWTRVAIPPDKALDPVSQWSVDVPRRVVICEGNHGHEWLRYDRELGDFILHVEWRFTKLEGGKGYNSGGLCPERRQRARLAPGAGGGRERRVHFRPDSDRRQTL